EPEEVDAIGKAVLSRHLANKSEVPLIGAGECERQIEPKSLAQYPQRQDEVGVVLMRPKLRRIKKKLSGDLAGPYVVAGVGREPRCWMGHEPNTLALNAVVELDLL